MTAQLSRERILEMEEEMNRFEQEIAQPQGNLEGQSFGGPKVTMIPREPEPSTSAAIQFIPHQLQHPRMAGPPPGELHHHPHPPPPPHHHPQHHPVFMGQAFPPQNMMAPMQMPMPPAPAYGPQPVIGPMPVGGQGFMPSHMGQQHFQPPPAPPAPIVIANPPAPPEMAIVAAPTVYAAPPVKLVTVYQEPKAEAAKPLPPPPPLPAALKPDVRVEVPPAAVHKGVVGRPPEHSYEEPTATTKRSSSKKKKIIRLAGNQIWEDNSLMDWELDDFRIFCGDLGNDVTDEILTRAFGRYPSFIKAKVVRDKRTNKTKGYGFVSFRDPHDFIKAMREMNGKYVGSRPIKLRKSCWRDRNIEVVRKKQKEKEKLGLL